MAIPSDTTTRENKKFVESSAVSGVPAIAVVNPDGTNISGGGGGGGAVTVADGADVTQGAIADAAVTAGATGSVSSKLRSISRDIGTVATNLPAKGQAAMAASTPVTVASDQSTLPVGGNVASGASDSGNPVKVGAKFNSTLPTFTDGQRGDLQITSRGVLQVNVVTSGGTQVTTRADNADGQSPSATANNFAVVSRPTIYNGATYDLTRTPNVFKTATATASGDTAVWTPNTGKKFRVMNYSIQVTADAAQSVAGDIDIVLRDNTTATAAALSVYVPGAAGTTFGAGVGTGWVTLGNGFLSATANNVLNINLSAALTSGKVRVVVAGTEE